MAGMSVTGVGRAIDMFESVRIGFGQDVVYVTGTNVEYAPFVELGTSRQEAQPYLFRAARQVNRSFDRFAAEHQSMVGLVKRLALEIEALAKQFVPVQTGNLRGSISADRVR